VEQRRAALEAKIHVHEQARVFYMPDFVPPPSDANVQVERVSLHLPSSLGSARRKQLCPPALVQAERDIRLAAMTDALEDLLRQLRTRTYLQRFSARNIQGKRAGTRSRSSIAGITRRVDAAAAAYHRHRTAYKALAGEDRRGWERIFRPLTAADVRGLSEKAISDEEVHERYRITELAKALEHVARTASKDVGEEDAALGADDIPDEADESEFLDDDLMESSMGGLAEAVAPGEGTRKLSWIWVAGLQLEDVEDPQLTDGPSALADVCHYTDFVLKASGWSGLAQRPVPIAGPKRLSSPQRKCGAILPTVSICGAGGRTSLTVRSAQTLFLSRA
jgi:hypothetical protein